MSRSDDSFDLNPNPTMPTDAVSRYPASDQPEPHSSLNPNTFVAGKPVYRALTEHQRGEEEWTLHSIVQRLHEWWDILDDEFALQIPAAPLRLEVNLHRNCLGYYRKSHNGLGLENEIAINLPAAAVSDGKLLDGKLDWGDTLGTLLHEQLHFKQALYGRPGMNNYHNVAYRSWAKECGLLVNDRGHQTYEPRGRFLMLLLRHGVPWPRWAAVSDDGPSPTPLKLKMPAKGPGSKLRLWVCQCPVRARVAVPRFNVRCLDCGQTFRRAN